MSKFKVGDKVYSIFSGIGHVDVIYDEDESIDDRLVELANGELYTKCGRAFCEDDLNPTLLTLEEARAKGYYVPPEEPKKKQVYQWAYRSKVTGHWLTSGRLMTEEEAKLLFEEDDHMILSGPFEVEE